MKRSVRAVTVLLLVVTWCVLTLPASASSPVELRFQYWRLSEEPAGTILKDFIKEYESRNPGVKIVIESVPYAQRNDKFMTQALAGTPPDVIGLTTNDMPSFAARGLFRDVTEWTRRDGLDKVFYPGALDAATYKRCLYGLPDNVGSDGLAYNRTLFKNAGLSPDRAPDTWQEFLDVTRKLTRDTSGDKQVDKWGYGMIASRSTSTVQRLWIWFWTNGAEILSAEGDEVLLPDPKANEVMEFYTGLVTKEQVVPPGALAADYNAVVNMWIAGDVAMMQNGPYMVGLLNSKDRADLVDALQFAPLPVNRAGVYRAKVDAAAFFIPKGSKKAEAAWDFVKFLTNYENNLRWAKEAYFLPSRIDVGKDAFIAKDRHLRAFTEGIMPHGRPIPKCARFPEMLDILNVQLQEVLMGRKNVQAAMDALANEIKGLLQ